MHNIIVYNSTINNITTQTQHISHGSVNSVSGTKKFGFDIFGSVFSSRYFLPSLVETSLKVDGVVGREDKPNDSLTKDKIELEATRTRGTLT